jgi:hypothetical protein
MLPADGRIILFRRIPAIGGDTATRMSMRSLLRFSMPVSILLYCASFHYAYVNWISPVWGYGGLTYRSPNRELIVFAYVLASVVCAISPRKLLRPSQVIYWVLYFTVFIPGLFVPLFLQLDPEFSLFLLQVSLAIGMVAIALSYRFSLLRVRPYPLSARSFWEIFAAVYLVGNAALVIAYRNNLHFASLETMYSLRHQASRVIEGNPAIGYVSQLLGSVMNPLLMAYGLASRRKYLVVLGILGELLVYSASPAKVSILSPLMVAGLYYTIKNDRGGWVPKLGLFLAGLCFSLTTLVIGGRPGVFFNVATIALVRTIATPGMMMGQYQYFFENQPHTYLGHVTGFNLLVSYPYKLPIGYEISAFYGVKEDSERGRTNENANFFATDGIGGFGLPGIPLMGILCAAVFWVLDSCTRYYSMEFSVSALAMVMMSLGNVSLFSTLLGNGMIAWMLLFMIMPSSFRGANFRADNLSIRS